MLMRPDSPGLKFMLLGNSGDAGFSVDSQLMTSLRLSRFQQARREAETGLVVWDLYSHRKRCTRLCGHVLHGRLWPTLVGFAAGRPKWWQSFDFWVSLLLVFTWYCSEMRSRLVGWLLAHLFKILASFKFCNFCLNVPELLR